MLIFFTGGGSAGHVTPNIALIEQLQKEGFHTAYVGSEHGIEASLIKPLHIPYYAISTGKLRRQWDWRNLLTPWQVVHGIWQSFWLCRRHKPGLLFSKGGFVAVPIVIGAWLNKIPVITHESDLSPGLANRLVYPLVKKIALSFPQSERYFKDKHKLVYTGSPIRPFLFTGHPLKAKTLCHFTDDKPVLFIYGGGLGSVKINESLWAALPLLLPHFNIIHACGKGKTNAKVNQPGYYQTEYLQDELADVLALADLVISRAGANSIMELLALAKVHLLIPLSKQASRGDQLENAAYYQSLGLSQVLLEEELSPQTLHHSLNTLWPQRAVIQQRIQAYALPNATEQLLALIKNSAHE